MSNAMRKGKRTLAGVAAVGLSAALIPFVGVGAANSAVTSVTQPDAVRANVATAATGYAINGTSLGSNTADAYIFSAISGNQFASPAAAGGSVRPNADGNLVQPNAVTFAAQNAGLTVTVGVYKATADGGTCEFTALGTTGVEPTATATGGTCTVTLETTFTQAVGGAIASIAMTPATSNTVVGGTATYAITAVDENGIRTLTDPDDLITPVSSNTGVATVTFDAAAMTITATGVAAGTANVNAVPLNASVATVTSTVSVVASGATSAATDVQLSGSNILPNATTVGARTYFVNPVVSSLTFEVSGLTAGATYVYTATGGGVTVSPTGGSLTADASGNAAVTVAATTPANTNTVTFVVVDGAGAANKTAVATYQTPALAWESPTPADNSVLFGTASSTVAINVKVADQYGNPGTNTSVVLADGTGTVDTKVLNASGEATLTANVPATGATAYTVTPGGAGAGIGVRNVTVRAGTVTLTTTSGLSTDTTTVTTASWTDTPGAVETGDTTAVVMNVAQAGTGIQNVPVTITAGEGALLFAAAPAAPGVSFTTGETSLVVNSAANGDVEFWATASRSGVVTVTASAGGETLTGNFTGEEPAAGSARNVTVDAPRAIESGGVAIVNIVATDNFGSTVVGANVTVSFAPDSPGFFAGGTRSVTVTTGLNGLAQTVVTAGANESGTMVLAVGAAGEQQFAAIANRLTSAATTDNAVGYTASNVPAAVDINIGSVITPSIIIEGEREGRRIAVIGETQGIAEGTIVRPWIRFPGETSYNLGAAQRSVSIVDAQDEIGEFAWGRRTGKRTAVIFRTEDQSVSSTRIIIPAR